LPKNAIEMNLANVAAKEIARQLTLIGIAEGRGKEERRGREKREGEESGGEEW
jgi:hypothetical protein